MPNPTGSTARVVAKLLWRAPRIACALTLLPEFVSTSPDNATAPLRRSTGYFGFYAAPRLRRLRAHASSPPSALGYVLKKPEDYYGDEDEPLADTEPGAK